MVVLPVWLRCCWSAVGPMTRRLRTACGWLLQPNSRPSKLFAAPFAHSLIALSPLSLLICSLICFHRQADQYPGLADAYIRRYRDARPDVRTLALGHTVELMAAMVPLRAQAGWPDICLDLDQIHVCTPSSARMQTRLAWLPSFAWDGHPSLIYIYLSIHQTRGTLASRLPLASADLCCIPSCMHLSGYIGDPKMPAPAPACHRPLTCPTPPPLPLSWPPPPSSA